MASIQVRYKHAQHNADTNLRLYKKHSTTLEQLWYFLLTFRSHTSLLHVTDNGLDTSCTMQREVL